MIVRGIRSQERCSPVQGQLGAGIRIDIGTLEDISCSVRPCCSEKLGSAIRELDLLDRGDGASVATVRARCRIGHGKRRLSRGCHPGGEGLVVPSILLWLFLRASLNQAAFEAVGYSWPYHGRESTAPGARVHEHGELLLQAGSGLLTSGDIRFPRSAPGHETRSEMGRTVAALCPRLCCGYQGSVGLLARQSANGAGVPVIRATVPTNR